MHLCFMQHASLQLGAGVHGLIKLIESLRTIAPDEVDCLLACCFFCRLRSKHDLKRSLPAAPLQMPARLHAVAWLSMALLRWLVEAKVGGTACLGPSIEQVHACMHACMQFQVLSPR